MRKQLYFMLNRLISIIVIIYCERSHARMVNYTDLAKPSLVYN